MITTAARTKVYTMPLARMSGHRNGYRVLNGGVPGSSVFEQEFRYRMHELCGAADRLELMATDSDEYAENVRQFWSTIAGLHGYMKHTARMDEMLTFLMMARKVWKRGVIPHRELKVLRECMNRMAKEEHAVKLTTSLGRQLLDAGVDVRMGF